MTQIAALERAFRTSKGNHYSYTHKEPRSDSATLLFLHGFPSHKGDWIYQKGHFEKLGYGIILLDILGFGRSEATTARECYHWRSMSNDITELLDHLQVKGPVIGIGHDLGAMLLSRLAIWHPERIEAVIYIAVGPHKLGLRFDVDAINSFTKSMMGHEYLGYIDWMVTDPSAQHDLETHAESAMKLIFCDEPELWNSDFRPAGAMKAFVTQDKEASVGPWFSSEMQKLHLELYKRSGGYKGAISWYKMMANNDSIADEQHLEDQMMEKPAMLIVPEHEAIQQKDTVSSWHTNLSVEPLSCGHWVHMERAAETNKIIEGFLACLVSGENK